MAAGDVHGVLGRDEVAAVGWSKLRRGLVEFIDVGKHLLVAVKLGIGLAVFGAGLVLCEDRLRELVGVFEEEVFVPPCEGFYALAVVSPVSLPLQEVLLRRRDLFFRGVGSEYGCEEVASEVVELHESVEMRCELVIEKVFVAVMAVDQLQDGLVEEGTVTILEPLVFFCQALNNLQDLRHQAHQIRRNRLFS